ncbi:M48 family metalloprotease [Arenimonas terrae]|uniref:Hydrolase n=1 Tax=Arenimonas terrae TaxID=2546226 RepID=A0A5C4RPD4_9GAMM|nr:M48 family metalloprotease [Arenimonas terrae]TNJ33113.1 hydrolase [Arenimonas terrae]
MERTIRDGRDLTPLRYHRDVVDYLKQHEPDIWIWAASLGAQEQHARETRDQLLRDSYRLTPESHPLPYRLCALAMQRLGMDAPATIYQANDYGGGMNAMLCFLPGQVHLLLQGPLLERLSEDELLALMGHELAHHLLWSLGDGEFLVADRILHHTLADPGAAASHVETSRLYRLHTEVFADRGGAVAAQALEPPVCTLVKVQTGIASVDAAAYLQQAKELETADAGASTGQSHPESYLRAQALERWWHDAPDTEGWLQQRLRGPLDLARLDLTAQVQLVQATRTLLSHYFADPALQAERLLLQAREFFPDWSPEQPRLPLPSLGPATANDSIRDFLHSVMLDLALADADLRDPALRRALQVADDLDSRAAFLKALARDAGLGKREIDRLAKAPAKERGQ